MSSPWAATSKSNPRYNLWKQAQHIHCHCLQAEVSPAALEKLDLFLDKKNPWSSRMTAAPTISKSPSNNNTLSSFAPAATFISVHNKIASPCGIMRQINQWIAIHALQSIQPREKHNNPITFRLKIRRELFQPRRGKGRGVNLGCERPLIQETTATPRQPWNTPILSY